MIAHFVFNIIHHQYICIQADIYTQNSLRIFSFHHPHHHFCLCYVPMLRKTSFFFDWMSFCVWWICYMQILSHYVREPHMVWNNVKLRDKTWELHAHIYMWENKLDAVSSLLLLIRILEMLPSALLQSWDWEHSHKQFNY